MYVMRALERVSDMFDTERNHSAEDVNLSNMGGVGIRSVVGVEEKVAVRFFNDIAKVENKLDCSSVQEESDTMRLLVEHDPFAFQLPCLLAGV